jgi:hypothetical protein
LLVGILNLNYNLAHASSPLLEELRLANNLREAGSRFCPEPLARGNVVKLTTPPSAESIEIFFSYSHEDEGLRKELEKHLSLMWRQGIAKNWHDRMIGIGTEWAGQIDKHLNSAQIILLLISADFLASEYCYGIEMTRALERHKRGEARVIPILLRDVDWSRAPFKELQFLPRGGQPVTRWADKDEAFASIAREIRRVVDELTGKATVESATPFTDARPVEKPVKRMLSWGHFLALGLLIVALVVGGLQYASRRGTGNARPSAQPVEPPAAQPTLEADAGSEKRELLRQKLAFAAGWSVALIGQSKQRAGIEVFSQAVRDLGFEAIEARELEQEYAAIDKSVQDRAISYQDFERAKARMLATVRERLQALAGERPTPYVSFGHDLCALMLLLRFWEELQKEGDLRSTASDRLLALQLSVQKVSLPARLYEKIRQMRADLLADNGYRKIAEQTLGEVLDYFDMQPI